MPGFFKRLFGSKGEGKTPGQHNSAAGRPPSIPPGTPPSECETEKDRRTEAPGKQHVAIDPTEVASSVAGSAPRLRPIAPDRFACTDRARLLAGTNTRLGDRYEVHHIFGGAEGHGGVHCGMGIVYVCYDNEFREVFALKTLQDRHLASRQLKERFRREAETWVKLGTHPNIVRAVTVQEIDLRLFIILEYIAPDDGGRNRLTEYLESPIPPHQALAWAVQVCHGMEHAADCGLTCHRDLKPDNLMITRDGVAKITDFGLAAIDWKPLAGPGTEDRRLVRCTDGKVIAGSPPWMAPEQFRGQSDVRSDIYGFGVVLYQMATGRLTFLVTFLARTVDEFRRAHELAPPGATGSPYDAVVQRCLQKAPENRYGSFRALRMDLEAVYRREFRGELPSPPKGQELDAWELLQKSYGCFTLGLIEEMAAAASDALRLFPSLPGANHNLGMARYLEGHLDEAIGHYRRELNVFRELLGNTQQPTLATRFRDMMAMTHSMVGIALHDKGLYDDAVREHRETLRLMPSLAEGHTNLANALQALGRLDEAICEYREALRLKPTAVKARSNLAVILARKGMTDEAVAELRESLRLKPDSAAGHANLANALAQKGSHEAAVSEYREAICIDPQLTKARVALASALVEAGGHAEAVQQYREALRTRPGDSEVRLQLADALVCQGSLAEAADEYYHLLRLHPDCNVALLNLGEVLERLGAAAEAAMAYEAYLRNAASECSDRIGDVRERIRRLRRE